MSAYVERQAVFAQGDPADCIFYIHDGKVKVTVISNQGKEAVVAILGSGQFFGEGCLAGQTHRMGSVIALTECTIARLEKRVVVQVLHDEPAFSALFITYLWHGTYEWRRIWSISSSTLARSVWHGSSCFGRIFGKEGKPELVIAKINQETLAEMIGTIRSRVSFFMNKFDD